MDIHQSIKPKLLTLVDFHHPVLREVLEPVQFPLSAEDKQFIHDMKYSIQPPQLSAANAPWASAAGMAANQWGLRKRIFLFCPDKSENLEVMINPSYEPLTHAVTQLADENLSWEACFSVPLATGNVKRYTDIRAQYQNEQGDIIVRELHGRHARVFQHETDHLNGLLYYELSTDKCIHKRNFSSRQEVDAFYDHVHASRKSVLANLPYCPCGSGMEFTVCCKPYLNHEQYPTSSLALMRSRYCAYFYGEWNYIQETMRGPALMQWNEQQNKIQHSIKWQGLKVVTAYTDVDPNIGFVEFVAKYKENGKENYMHELSQFHREDGRWYYVEGKTLNS